MHFKEYKTYILEDFVLDDSFRAYVLKTNAADQEFWSNWILFHPEKETEFSQAIALVESLRNTHAVVPAMVKEQELDRLLSRIEELEDEEKIIAFQTPKYKFWYSWRGMAASITGLILLGAALGGIFLNKAPNFIQYSTAYGETKEIVLPDNSVVILNSNSELKFNADWDTESVREVWVRGEAYFSVTHQQNHQKFRVTTADNFHVEVLGTKFNVADREYKNRVVLESGKVKLTLAKKNAKPAEFMMQPGELIEFNSASADLTRKHVDAGMYTSWKENVLVFDKLSLGEISAIFRENYGVAVVIADKKLAALQVSGVASTTDLEGFLSGLAKLHNFSIRKARQQLYIEPVT